MKYYLAPTHPTKTTTQARSTRTINKNKNKKHAKPPIATLSPPPSKPSPAKQIILQSLTNNSTTVPKEHYTKTKNPNPTYIHKINCNKY